MKRILLFVLITFPIAFVYAQKPIPGKSKSPEIITKLKPGKVIRLDQKSMKFIKVIEDSRCPSGVSCFWAGEAKVLIGFYENDTLIEEKEIIFGPKNITKDKIKELLVSEEKTVYGYSLSPYPKSGQKIAPSDYVLEMIVK